MSSTTPEVGLAAISLAVGWVGLWPVRDQLGKWGYHLCAFPVGLLGWCFSAVAALLLGHPFGVLSAAVGLFLYIALLWILCWLIARVRLGPRGQIGALSYVASGGALAVIGTALAGGRFTIVSDDSWGAYWPWAVVLSRTGEVHFKVLADRGLPLIALGAADILLGGDWAYLAYSLMAVSLALILLWLLLREPTSRVERFARLAVPAGVVAVLVVNATFVFNAFYVHSHMISALYLLLSLGALRMAVEPSTGEATSGAAGWLVVSGISAAGLALARPDGLAYVLLPAVAAISIVTDERWESCSVAAFFAPLLAIVYTVYAAAFFRHGLWAHPKLSGPLALVMMVGLGVLAALPRAIRVLERRLSRPLGGERLLLTVLGLLGIALGAAFVLKWDVLHLTVTHAAINLFGGQGAWSSTWYWIAALMILSVVSGDALRKRSSTRLLFLTTMLFFLITVLTNISRPGRIGDSDSVNRIVFHIVPVIVWYLGLVMGRVVGDLPRRSTAD